MRTRVSSLMTRNDNVLPEDKIRMEPDPSDMSRIITLTKDIQITFVKPQETNIDLRCRYS